MENEGGEEAFQPRKMKFEKQNEAEHVGKERRGRN